MLVVSFKWLNSVFEIFDISISDVHHPVMGYLATWCRGARAPGTGELYDMTTYIIRISGNQNSFFSFASRPVRPAGGGPLGPRSVSEWHVAAL